jgi:hypothetical protein
MLPARLRLRHTTTATDRAREKSRIDFPIGQIQKQELDAEPSTPEEFAKLIRTEMVKWAKVVKAAGIQPE